MSHGDVLGPHEKTPELDPDRRSASRGHVRGGGHRVLLRVAGIGYAIFDRPDPVFEILLRVAGIGYAIFDRPDPVFGSVLIGSQRLAAE